MNVNLKYIVANVHYNFEQVLEVKSPLQYFWFAFMEFVMTVIVILPFFTLIDLLPGKKWNITLFPRIFFIVYVLQYL